MAGPHNPHAAPAAADYVNPATTPAPAPTAYGDGDGCIVQAAPMAYVMTDADTETVNNLYLELKPIAIAGAREYVLARTPVHLNAAMQDLIAADFPPPAP